MYYCCLPLLEKIDFLNKENVGRRQAVIFSGGDLAAEPADAQLFIERTTLEEGYELGWLKLNKSREKQQTTTTQI